MRTLSSSMHGFRPDPPFNGYFQGARKIRHRIGASHESCMRVTVDKPSSRRFIGMRTQFGARASGYPEVSIEPCRGTGFKTLGDIGDDRASCSEHLVSKSELTPPASPFYHFPNRNKKLPGFLPCMKVLELLYSTHTSSWGIALQNTSSFYQGSDPNSHRISPSDSDSALCTLHPALSVYA